MISKHHIFTILVLITSNAWAITCLNPKTECLGANETRPIDGISVKLDCWGYRTTYECREDSDNNCEPLRQQKCAQVKVKCREQKDGICAVQDEIYSCPVEKCDETGKISCGKNIFCVNGNCASTNPVKATDKEIGRSLSYLAALNEIASSVKDQNSKESIIFTGKIMECASYAMPGITKDCCNNNAGLFSCDAEEEKLSQMKKAGIAIEVGEYCNNEDPVFHQCTSHHTAYCVFDSRIAKIIQNDGRKKQLGISFGYVNDDDKSSRVNCRGITKDELTKMKFDLMDFSELYDEMKKEAEKRASKEEALKQKSSGYSYDELKSRSTKNLRLQESPETGTGLKAAERIKDFYGERIKK